MRATLTRLAHDALWLYYSLLLLWTAATIIIGDRFAYLGLFNYGAVYLFFPLSISFFITLTARKQALWVPLAAAILVFLLLWGRLFIPNPGAVSTSSPQIEVMTYNVLATHIQTDSIMDAILSEDPDVVFIQELNNVFAGQLQSELSGRYPYQIAAPQDNPRGIGTISKYPLEQVDWRPQHKWISSPQVMDMSWQGRKVRLVNIHMHPTTRFDIESLAHDLRRRSEQAGDLVQLADPDVPLIIGGDANTSPLNQAYRILTSTYSDAWAEAGFGLGHTFPTPYIAEGRQRNMVAVFEIPAYVTRLDYILHSPHWQAVSAWLGPPDGVSDHRSVLTLLSLKD